MMNGKCRYNFQPPPCRVGMFKPNNFLSPIASSFGNWIHNTATIIFDPNRFGQIPNYRNYNANSNRYHKCLGSYTTPYANIDNVNNNIGLTPKHKNFEKDKTLNNKPIESDGIRLGKGFNRNNFKPGCDKNINYCYDLKYNNNEKAEKTNYRNCNKKNGYDKNGFKQSEKHKFGNPEHQELQKRYSSNNNQKINLKSNSNNNLKFESNSPTCNTNNKSTEVVAIFTLEDFPELPVPKTSNSWSFKFPGAFNSKHCTNKTNKIESTTSKNYVKQSHAQNDINLNKSENENRIEDNFVIIMERNSPQIRKRNQNSTAGFTPFKPRQRQISECSDDSFIICFTNDAADGEIEFTDISCDESDSQDSDSDNEIENHCKNNNENNVSNDKTENHKKNNLDTFSIESTSQPDSGFDDVKEKKVRFNLQPEVHVMHKWDYAYRAARKGDWENYARDRCRFKDRIKNVSPIISTVLCNQHRENIFKERFCNKNSNV